ncbi:MAG: KamA family radical SAM protein, partial [Candidatus Omnitrophica bacterium]|nr:KamA family radical SAM protein [Candidatus Omnitrophota bacterium]
KALLGRVTEMYHMRLPQYYFFLIKNCSDPSDPIARQCLPSVEEIDQNPNESIDPLAEEKMSPVSCLVHRYPDRALLLVTGRCFMYCRHCTRKRLWRSGVSEPTLRDFDRAFKYLKETKTIREVIVSGGDPLVLSSSRLDYILSSLKALEHIKVIRIGTRAPVVFPQRIDEGLCAVLKKYDNLWINLQFNHPREITAQSTAACRKLSDCGIPLNNQSVLLKGVNDDPQVMLQLCQKLQSIRVRPYYLFQCDPVSGAGHFRTQVSAGVEIIKKMRGYTSGMCIPTFVVDGTEGKGKVPLGPDYLVSASEKGMLLRNYKDELFFYDNPQNPVKPPAKRKKDNLVKAVGIVFNLRKNKSGSDQEEEFDEIETIEALKAEIEKQGFGVQLFEENDNLAQDIRRRPPDFIINLAEGRGSSRSRELQVPSILESLGIPYSGSDPVSLGITQDKALTSRILKAAGIPVPLMFTAARLKQLNRFKGIFRPGKTFLVKPRWEGSSKGIFLNSLVDNFSDLKERSEYIFSQYHQPVVIEEFLEKEEVTAGVSGNDSPCLLGMMKIVPKDQSGEKFIYSLEVKRQWEEKVTYQPQNTIAAGIQRRVKLYALKAYQALELKDFARIDFRVGQDNLPRIIDINPLPGLSPRYSDLPILYRLKGRSYSDLIKALLETTFKRYGLKAV